MSKQLELNESFYKELLIWDSHAGIFPSPDVDLSRLQEWHEDGVSYVSINVGFDVMSWDQTMNTLIAYRRYLMSQQDKVVLASTMADVIEANKNNKLAVTFDIEGMNALNENLDMVRAYHALGVRQMLFAYNLNNAASGGCHDEDIGLTKFGKEVLSEMNDVGIIADASHTSYKTSMDIMSLSNKPAVFSHSNPSGVFKHERNITDEQIKACAKTGGVIGANGMGIFLGNNDTSTENFLKHVCYLCDLVGAEHVGFGLDYSPKMDIDIGEILAKRPDFWPPNNGYDTPNIGHYSPTQLHGLMEGMFEKGFSKSEIEGVLGGNFRRVATDVWAN